MDYCSTCRRTLNGVFVCPGCGAYAPDVAPAGSHLHHTPSTVAVMAEISPSREFDAFPGFAEPETPEADVPVGPATASATGRAARRRRLADWKKQRRRAVVASTVALVGGGLTLAFMPSSRPSVSQAHASTPTPVAPSTDGAATDTAPEAEGSRNGAPRTSDHGTRPSGSVNSPGSAASTTPVDAPAKRETAPRTSTGDTRPTRPTAEPEPQSPDTAPTTPDAPPPPPPAAEQPTPQPNQPTSPAQPPPPPPTAEPPQDDSSELCVLVLCVGLDAGN